MERGREGRIVGRIYSCYVACMKPRSLSAQEPTLKTITSTLETVVSAIVRLDGSIGGLQNQVNSLDKKVGSLDKRMDSLSDTVEFMKENVVTKDEFTSEIHRLENTIIDHVDHFVHLHKKQEVELVALGHRMTRHEETYHKKG